nr:hypothetical protein [Tanacetum cinerariifolium]
MSFDDLYNNFKIVEQEVKRTVVSSSSSGSPNMAFLSSLSSTNKVDTASIQVSAASTPVSTVSSPNNSANLKQIQEDDLEENDLKWQLALLSMRAKRYFQRTGKKITINGSDTAGYDKTNVECFNCHKMGHFARECRSPRSQESRPMNQDNSRKTVFVEDTSSKAMVSIDGAGFDWSYMGDDEVPTNIALMAFSDLEVHNSKTCSNTCLKSFKTLKNQYDNLRIKLNKSEFNLANYKRGLASVEEQLFFYKKNKVVFCDQIAVLKRYASFRESDIIALNLQLEKLKKEKERNQIKIDNFKNTSKSLDKLIGSQITDNSKTGLGFTSYNAVAPPPTGLFAPPTIDLSSFGLEEFKQPEFESYGPKASKSVCVDTSNVIKKVSDALIIEDWVSDYDEDESFCHLIKDCDFHDKKMIQKPVLKTVEKGSGQREVRPVWNHAMRVNHQNFSNYRRNFAPTAVLTKSGIVPISIARQSSSRVAAPVSTARPINTAEPKPIVNVAKSKQNAFQKTHSLLRRPFHQQIALKNRYLVKTAKVKSVNTVNTAKGKSMTGAVGKQGSNAVKSSACWVWRPKIKVQDHVSKNNRSYICKRFDYVDPEGRLNGYSRHMTGNKSFLLDYQEYNRGFVAFTGNSKGGSGLEWLFDIDSLTNLMNYQPISARNRINGITSSKIHSNVGQEGKEKVSDQEYILLPVLNTGSYVPSSNEEVESSPKDDAGKKSIVKPTCVEGGNINDLGCLDQQMKSTYDSENTNSTNSFNNASPTVNTASDKDGTFQRTYGEWNFSTTIPVNAADSSFSHPYALDDFSKMPNLEDIGIFNNAYDDRDEGAEADYNSLETGHRQEEGIDYDEVFAPVARIEAIKLFLAYTSFMDFTVLCGSIISDKVYKVEEDLYGLHQAPRAWPDIMFDVCACSRFQVQPKVSHMHAVKRIFRYLKGHPTLGLWYPKDLP